MPPTHTHETFNPRAYLEEYYAHIGAENEALLQFYADAFKTLKAPRLLDFGGGPTIYPLISAVPQVKEMYFSDYLPANIEEVRRWICAWPDAFNWEEYICRAIVLEGETDAKEDIKEREAMIRRKITHLIPGDATLAAPLGVAYKEYFDIVITNFVSECITPDRTMWSQYTANIISMLKPGGRLLLAMVTDAEFYKIGETSLPVVPLTEKDIVDVLVSLNFDAKTIHTKSIPAETQPGDGAAYQGYTGILMLQATKGA